MKKRTNGTPPKPWDFPLATEESRAAARAMLEAHDHTVTWSELQISVQRPRRDNSIPHISPWYRTLDGYMRIVYVPQDETAAETPSDQL